jgi:hypothetical protein
VQVCDGRADQIVGGEELRLGLSTAAAPTVPPAGSIRVEIGARGTGDLDTGALDLEQWAGPFFVAPGGLALEDDLRPHVSVNRASDID